MNKELKKTSNDDVRIEDLVRFMHPLTGKKEIGVLVKKKPLPSMKIKRIETYIRYGIICKKELIWITSDSIYELEKIDV